MLHNYISKYQTIKLPWLRPSEQVCGAQRSRCVTHRPMIFVFTSVNNAWISLEAKNSLHKEKNGSSLKETRGRQARIHFYNLLIAKVLVHSCIFSMVSSLYLPFSFPSVRDLALRSRIFLRSLSSFSLVITTYIYIKKGHLMTKDTISEMKWTKY